MVGRLLEGYWRAQLSRLTADAYMGEEKNVADAELGDTLDERARAWREADPSQDADLQTRTRRAVEHRLLRHGDDGLLEYLHETSEQARDPDFASVHELSGRLLERRLHKLVGRCTPRAVTPEDLYAEFGEDAEIRRALEVGACRWAG